MTCNEVAREIVDIAYHIYINLGPVLLESVYEIVLGGELARRGLSVLRQQSIPIIYNGLDFEVGFRADLIVQDLVIVEIKSVETIMPVHLKQLLTYLRLTDKRLGLLINFNVELIKDGIRRVANGLDEPDFYSRKGAKAQSK